MDKLQVTGGCQLQGEIFMSGAKNAALPILAASLLSKESFQLSQLPALNDVFTMIKLLQGLGAKVDYSKGGEASISCNQLTSCYAEQTYVAQMRASVLVLGPLLAHYGMAKVALPGGCAIGSRPVDLHIKGLRAMGAEIVIKDRYIWAEAVKGLQGANIHLDKVSVGATENLMMAATLATGITVINNAACEPEVVDLANFLRGMGAFIQGDGTSRVTIKGVQKLRGCRYQIMPDRIETATYLVAAAMTYGDVRLRNTQASNLASVLEKLTQAGARVETSHDWISLCMKGRKLKAVNLQTAPYPLFPTDLQAQFCALNSVAEGRGIIVENIFENRFMQVAELQRMGADLVVQGHWVYSRGVKRLTGCEVQATDLRAAASLLLAGLVAEGDTMIDQIFHLDRGYERVDEKFAALGAKLARLNDNMPQVVNL